MDLFEASAYPEVALSQANRLERLMPMAEHMVHMPSHIYIRLGRYDSTIAVNQRSIEADEYFLPIPYLVLKIFGRWNEILAEPMPDLEYPFLQGMWHYARGSAFIAKGRMDSAKAELGKIIQLIPEPTLSSISCQRGSFRRGSNGGSTFSQYISTS